MKYSVWNRIVLPVLFTIAFVLGLSQGDCLVKAYSNDFLPTSYKINNVTYSDEYIRAVSSYPVLVDTYELDNGHLNYLFEINVNLNIRFPANNGYYSCNSTATVNMEYPSNAGVLQTRIKEYHNSEGYNVSNYSFTTSSENHSLRGYFRIMGQDKYIYKQASTYFYQLVSFTVQIRTDSETAPTLSFTNVSSNINFMDGQSYVDSVIEAIDNSDTSEDIADILTTSGLTLTEVRNIATQLGVANNHLTYIQEYAYEIYNILNNQYPTDASEALEDAESNLSNLNNDINTYQPQSVSPHDVNSSAQNAYMSMQLEGDSTNLFWYLNWPIVLAVITLIFALSILSYILFGGK